MSTFRQPTPLQCQDNGDGILDEKFNRKFSPFRGKSIDDCRYKIEKSQEREEYRTDASFPSTQTHTKYIPRHYAVK